MSIGIATQTESASPKSRRGGSAAALRPHAIFFARAAPHGHLRPAGTGELGFSADERVPL
jgi:hypothetical protein